MNRTDTAPATPPRSLAIGPLLIAGMILIAALSRLLPHPPNFSPVAAMALFGGAYFAHRGWAVVMPLLALLIADIGLGLMNGGDYWSYVATSATFWTVYACTALSSVLGFGLRGKTGAGRVLAFSLAGSVLFFLVTNFVVWLTATPVSGHSACVAGLTTCYVAAIPFFKSTLLGTLFYAALLFGGFAVLRRQWPALQARPA